MSKKTVKKNNETGNKPLVSTPLLAVTVAVLLAVALGITIKSHVRTAVTSIDIVNVAKPELPFNNEVKTNDVQIVGKSLKKLNIDFSRAVFLVGEVNEGIIQQISQIQQLSASSSEPIYLMLESPGGSVFDGLKMLSAIESAHAPVYTVAMGLCASMCAIIHQYGAKRYAFDRATLMFHDASGGFQGEVKRMATRLNYISRVLEKVDRKIAAKSNMSYEAYMALHQNELWIDSEDAAKLHLIDDVVATEYPMLLNSEPVPPSEEGKNRKEKVLDVRLITE